MLSLGYFGATTVLSLATEGGFADAYTATVGQDLTLLSDADVYVARAGEATDQDFLLKADTYARVSLLKGETLAFLSTADAEIRLTASN